MPRPRYPSDLTDAEWALIAPLIPLPKAGGRPALHPRRELINAIFYVLREGCTGRALPHDFPAWQTVYDYFRRWRCDGTWATLHTTLRRQVRLAAGRAAEPSAAILDSQSAKTTEKGGCAAMTAARRSRAASAIFSSIPSA
jgi:transposase